MIRYKTAFVTLCVLLLAAGCCRKKISNQGMVTYDQLSTLSRADDQVKVISSSKAEPYEIYNWSSYKGPGIPYLIIPHQSGKGSWVKQVSLPIDVTQYKVDNSGRYSIDEAMQLLIDAGKAVGYTSFYFPKGSYLVGQLDAPAGTTIKGVKGTTFIKKANSGKFSRMITSVKNKYAADIDSEPLIIENIHFDGRSHLQGSYEKYELEHQAMIFLHADFKKKGRLKAEIKNCTFQDGVGDAISVWCNADVIIDNIIAENVFRGAITITGGNTIVRASNVIALGDKHKTGIDVEIDAQGYNKSWDIEFYGDNFELAGDFDLGMKGGKARLRNIKSYDTPFNIYTPNSDVVIEDSEFHWNSKKGGHIYFPSNTTFRNTTFYYNRKDTSYTEKPINILWNTSYRESTDLNLRFEKCKFKSNQNPVIGLYNSADFAQNNNILTMVDCKFEGNFKACIDYHFGGTIDVKNTYFDGQNGVVLRSLEREKPYSYKATFEKISHSRSIETPVTYQDNDANLIILKDNTVNLGSTDNSRSSNGKTKILKQGRH